jgi:two-component system, OmpR family, sensor histidine kinase VicK
MYLPKLTRPSDLIKYLINSFSIIKMIRLSDESFAQRTDVLYNEGETVRRVEEQNNAIKYQIDSCIDVNGPSMFTTDDCIANHPVIKSYFEMKDRGVKLRVITEITKDNLKYCKEVMKIAEIRHLDEVKGNFGIGNKRVYHGGADTIKLGPPPQLIVSTVKSFVKQQQYFFDTLWNKAIPIQDKIKEIEEGIKPDVLETITDPLKIQTLYLNMIRTSKDEILLIIPTINALYRQENIGVIHLLQEIPAVVMIMPPILI